MIEGTTVGTVTDVNGNYVLNCPEQEGLTLVFSFVGMETQQVTVGERNEINVTMKAEIAEAQRLKDEGKGDGQPLEEKKGKRGKKKN